MNGRQACGKDGSPAPSRPPLPAVPHWPVGTIRGPVRSGCRCRRRQRPSLRVHPARGPASVSAAPSRLPRSSAGSVRSASMQAKASLRPDEPVRCHAATAAPRRLSMRRCASPGSAASRARRQIRPPRQAAGLASGRWPAARHTGCLRAGPMMRKRCGPASTGPAKRPAECPHGADCPPAWWKFADADAVRQAQLRQRALQVPLPRPAAR